MNFCVHRFLDCYDCSRHHPSDYEVCNDFEKKQHLNYFKAHVHE